MPPSLGGGRPALAEAGSVPPRLIQHEAITAAPGTDVAYAQFRSMFGLDSSAAGLAAAAANPTKAVTVQFGVPLTQAEQDDLEARGSLQTSEQQLQDVVASLSAVTGGVYRDQKHAHGQYVVVALPTLTDAQQASIVAAVPAGGTLRFEPGQLSADQMAQVTGELTATFNAGGPQLAAVAGLAGDFAAAGVTPTVIGAFGPDLPTDTVNISVAGMTPALAAQLQAALVARIPGLPPGAFSFSSGGPTIATDARYDKPGQSFGGTGVNVGTTGCTSNIDATDVYGTLYMITAGHCATSPGQTGEVATHNGNVIGTVVANYFANGTDAELIQLLPGGRASPYVYTQYPNDIPKATTVTGTKSPMWNDAICLDGVTTYRTMCSMVTGTNRTFAESINNPNYHNPYTFSGQDSQGFTSQPGDSGGSNGYNGVEYGLTNGAIIDPITHLPNGTSFTPIQNLAGLTPLTTTVGTPADWSTQVSRLSGMCMDVQYNATANGTPIWSYTCNSNPAQQWTLVPNYGFFVYTIQRFATRFTPPGECLDVNIAVGHGGHDPGTPVQEWQCNGWDNQQWRLLTEPDGHYEVISMHSGNCLDLNNAVMGGGYLIMTPIQTYTCLGPNQMNQHWRLG